MLRDTGCQVACDGYYGDCVAPTFVQLWLTQYIKALSIKDKAVDIFVANNESILLTSIAFAPKA